MVIGYHEFLVFFTTMIVYFPCNNFQEEAYFAESLNASDLIHPRWENRNDRGLTKDEIVNTYFELLDDDEVAKLYEVYKDDFKVFGYTFEFRGVTFNAETNVI